MCKIIFITPSLDFQLLYRSFTLKNQESTPALTKRPLALKNIFLCFELQCMYGNLSKASIERPSGNIITIMTMNGGISLNIIENFTECQLFSFSISLLGIRFLLSLPAGCRFLFRYRLWQVWAAEFRFRGRSWRCRPWSSSWTGRSGRRRSPSYRARRRRLLFRLKNKTKQKNEMKDVIEIRTSSIYTFILIFLNLLVVLYRQNLLVPSVQTTKIYFLISYHVAFWEFLEGGYYLITKNFSVLW